MRKSLLALFSLIFYLSCSGNQVVSSPQCIDHDGDQYGMNCPQGDDCNDNNTNNWNKCNECKDEDGDRYFVDCNNYKTISGPDCNDKIAGCGEKCADKNKNEVVDCAEYWIKVIGGSGVDKAYSAVADNNDNIYVVGNTSSFGAGQEDIYVVKLDKEGNVVWQKTYGNNGNDQATSAIHTEDDKIIIVGGTESYGKGSSDGWIIKIDRDGNIDWEKTVGGSLFDEIRSVNAVSSNEYVFTGYTRSFRASEVWDGWIGKFNGEGNILWQKTAGGGNLVNKNKVDLLKQGWFYFASISPSSNGIISTGYAKIVDNTDAWIVSMSKAGELVWDYAIGVEGFESATGITQLMDSNYIVGYTDSNTKKGRDLIAAKITVNGDLIWTKTFGTNLYDEGRFIAPTQDGNLLIVGNTKYYKNRNQDFLLIKITPEGNILWQKVIGGETFEEARFAMETKSGIIIVGDTNLPGSNISDIMVVKLDRNGNLNGKCLLNNNSSFTSEDIEFNKSRIITKVSLIDSSADVSQANMENGTAFIKHKCPLDIVENN